MTATRRGALAVFGVVLLAYGLTLAPTVTWWDAGEFIAAAKTLGIPHPPGTPLFVLLAHVWGRLVPVGEFAFRTNLLAAVCGATAAAGFFLLVRTALAGAPGADTDEGGRSATVIAAAAALLGACTFTTWQNANETEVYALATAMIAWAGVAMLRWRSLRRTDAARARRAMLAAILLLGLSVCVHLLALLAGPALVAFTASVVARDAQADAAARRAAWAEVSTLAGVWLLLVGTGLGSGTLGAAGAAGFVVASVVAVRAGRGAFAASALLLALLGITPYLFLYLRAGQAPPLNEADPSTWDALLAVIRRAQYPVRTPFDDPTVMHGPDNPGRSLTIIGLQALNYLQYFDWQWARGLPGSIGPVPLRTVFTVAAFSLGLRGLGVLRRLDRDVWWLLLVLLVVTGPGLMGYMNFKPGASVGWSLFPEPSQHEVRERDYFFLVSFTVWGLLAGLGASTIAAGLRRAWRVPAVLVVALVPLALNWPAASRRGDDAQLPADVAYDLLNSVPPYGILFTYGDNDTFPLWWAQEVAGIRRDVTVICLALANTGWYMRQLRDRRPDRFDAAAAPLPWRGYAAEAPVEPLHDLSDEEIRRATTQATYTDRPVEVDFGAFRHVIPANTILEPSDLLAMRVLRRQVGRRTIAWSVTAGGAPLGLAPRTVQQGLVFRLAPVLPDSADARYDRSRLAGVPLDVALTDTLAWQTYRYAGLEGRRVRKLETISSAFANSLGIPFTQLAYAYTARGDTTAALRNLRRAAEISDDETLREAVRQAERARGAMPSVGPPKP